MEETARRDSQKDKSLCYEPTHLEVVRGPTGRRRWSAREKARIVCESFGECVSVSAVARKHGLRPNQLFLWRRQARKGALVLPGETLDEVGFAPVVVGPEPATVAEPEEPSTGNIEIEAGGVTVRLCSRTPASRIGEIAAALRCGR